MLEVKVRVIGKSRTESYLSNYNARFLAKYQEVVACPRVKVLRKVVNGRSPPFDPADKGMVDLRYASEEVTDTEADKGTHPGHAF
ncbi:hypothetical protein Q3G72_013751 [Acer saccharum]|nr:hypothetical protein Q3G72_013751 [Acer saccharum]